MEILYFCTTWGQKYESWDEFFQKVRAAGYDGVETSFPAKGEEQDFLDCLKKHDLAFIGQHWQTISPDFATHKREYSEHLLSLASLNPLFINSHTGRDHFSFEQNTELLEQAAEITHGSGVKIYHETHRKRFAFAAHIARPYLEHSRPELTLDLSHWCCVAESLLSDQQESLALALDLTRHIHARVGFEQGPQVPDFTLAEYDAALQFHLGCWDQVVRNNEKSGKSVLTITSEFGPPPYMQNPSAEAVREKQWNMNIDIMNLLKARYK